MNHLRWYYPGCVSLHFMKDSVLFTKNGQLIFSNKCISCMNKLIYFFIIATRLGINVYIGKKKFMKI